MTTPQSRAQFWGALLASILLVASVAGAAGLSTLPIPEHVIALGGWAIGAGTVHIGHQITEEPDA